MGVMTGVYGIYFGRESRGEGNEIYSHTFN
ncbi:MAG: hypothetical protein CM15mV68_010 [uncultured marine virus]|nr:MAG: hypothetical protein CM15mV68_010 [uncultured marine virus]